jgi:hypothetical protein
VSHPSKEEGMGLTGPSRSITVEPDRSPITMPEPAPERERDPVPVGPERERDTDREKVPAGA